MPEAAFRTAGVDLASQDKRTAMAEVRWDAPDAILESARMAVSNDAIVGTADRVQLIGLDCPLGWPRQFTDLLIASRAHLVPPDVGNNDLARRKLAYRSSDFEVYRVSHRWPLSVSADRIAYPAMRCAGLLGRLEERGYPVCRGGINSVVAEVYPVAAMRMWDLPTAGYKADPAKRGALVDEMARRSQGWLDWELLQPACRQSHDVLDAVVCALVAGAVALGRTRLPDDQALADEEGWIHLPDQAFLANPWRR